jgi:hypothetical protein
VAEATQKASNKFGAERQSIIKECLEKITLNKPFGSRTENLIRSLEQQLEVCEILPPSCLRSYSSSARRQRGGDFASKGVALMRGLSQGVVEEACSQGAPSFSPQSGPNLAPPLLVRQKTGSIFTTNITPHSS